MQHSKTLIHGFEPQEKLLCVKDTPSFEDISLYKVHNIRYAVYVGDIYIYINSVLLHDGWRIKVKHCLKGTKYVSLGQYFPFFLFRRLNFTIKESIYDKN